MMAVLKLGHTYGTLSARRGDFEHWIVAGLGLSSESILIVDVTRGDSLPPYDRLAGLILTGSHEMVTKDLPWAAPLIAWIPGAVERQIPLLGICFGHQLLAHAMGGRVGYNPNGTELGTVSVTLHGSARRDRLLGGLGNPIRVHCCHAQSVLRLPQGAVCLGGSERDPNQAFSVGRFAWGVQFHPEFDAEITCTYVQQLREDLAREGQDPDRIMTDCRDTSYGPLILRRFASLIRDRAVSCEL